jgi:hypothetical protein
MPLRAYMRALGYIDGRNIVAAELVAQETSGRLYPGDGRSVGRRP